VQFYLAQILEGLSYIDDKKIIHRDIKLENVVVSADLNAKIVDFGTAKPVVLEDFYSK
jgi:serine/threonine protein kinase